MLANSGGICASRSHMHQPRILALQLGNAIVCTCIKKEELGGILGGILVLQSNVGGLKVSGCQLGNQRT